MTRHFLEIDDLRPDEVMTVLDLATYPNPLPVLKGRGVGLLFEKPSNRTRNSTEMAVVQLGGHPVSMRADEVGLGDRETPEDVARVLARYHAVLGARVFSHETLERMARVVDIPVINLLSDVGHPCQALADLLTLGEHWGGFRGRTLAYVGDGNNVCRSLMLGAAMVGLKIRIASPAGYNLSTADFDRARQFGPVEATSRAADAVKDVDAVYTDTWTSMGQESESTMRKRAFEGFAVDERLMAGARDDAVFLHCLPAHRGEEVTDAVMESKRSLVFRQAENRMHAMRGLFVWLMGIA